MLEVSPLKKARNSATQYFDLLFQTAESTVRAVCFSPEKRQRIEKYKMQSSSCALSNLQSSKSNNDLVLTSSSCVKEKILTFPKKSELIFETIDTIINELPVYARVNIKVKILTTSEVSEWKGLNLRECIVSDGANTIGLTVFSSLVDNVAPGDSVSITHVSVSSFKNQKKLKTTDLTVIKATEEIEVDERKVHHSPVKIISEEINVKSVIDESLTTTFSCPSCLVNMDEKPTTQLAKCSNCNATALSSACIGKVVVKLRTTSVVDVLLCPSELLEPLLNKDIKIGANDDFIIFLLSTKFIVKHVDSLISEIAVL